MSTVPTREESDAALQTLLARNDRHAALTAVVSASTDTNEDRIRTLRALLDISRTLLTETDHPDDREIDELLWQAEKLVQRLHMI